jgi:hypothetical protein
MKMEMQQMIEQLLTGQEQMMANTKGAKKKQKPD